MSEAVKWDFVSAADYLAAELTSETKHEYRDGVVYAMSGGSINHGQIATNATVRLGTQLQGKKCRVFNSDVKIRIRLSNEIRFYYPDLSVLCNRPSGTDQFAENPTLVMEVLSPSTWRTDMSEKKDAYLTMNSLEVYLVAESENARVIVWRRTPEGGFSKEDYSSLEDVIELPEIEAELSLQALYDGVI